MADGNLLRALAAKGHSAALRILENDPEAALEELLDGRERMWQAACLWLDMAWYEGGDELDALLEKQGCVRVSALVDPPASNLSYTNRTASLMRSIGRHRADVGVYLGDAGECRPLLSGFLAELEDAGYLVSAWRLTS